MVRLAFVALAALAASACAGPGDPEDGVPLGYPDASLGVDAGDAPDAAKTDDIDPDDVECPLGFSVRDDDCVVDGDARWDVRVIDGTFTPKQPSGSDWDVNNGLPDGYVWIEFGPERIEVETEVDSEKLEPVWNVSVLWAVTTDELRTHFDLRLYDYDKFDFIDGDDLMAGCLMPLPDEVFEAELFDPQDFDPDCPSVRLSLRFAN